MIELERSGNVFVARMNLGENRIGPAFLDRFNQILDSVDRSERASLVTTGSGRFYSNGLDIEGMSDLAAGTSAGFLGEFHRTLSRLLSFRRPTVAAINGHAFAAGAMLAVSHDCAVMRRDRGLFCLPEIDMATGQPLTPAMYALLEARVPAGTLHELIVTGRRIGGEQAAARKVVHEACNAETVLPRAIEIADRLARTDPDTLGARKRASHRDTLHAMDEG
ncbi:MAG: enoyl-CoA hydratase/isomerase family protein [Myxococcota bacterium]